jgi:LuxR family maltose regulon positive regulatory protein
MGHSENSAGSGSPDRHLLRAQPLDLKLRPPRPSIRLVERRQVLATLAATDAPLVLISAPAGAGKTLALLQWREADGRPFVWITLDESDDDPVVLLRSLVSGLVAVAPVDPALLELLELAVPPVDEQVVPGIVAALERAEPFVLVLDDAQCLGAPRCWQVVAALIAARPPGSQMALGTRRDPPLPLAAMRAQGRLAELRADDLAFGRDEAAELLGAHGGPGDGETVDDATLDAVLAATEGWAAGLYLATLAGRGIRDARPQGSWLAPPHGDRREIAGYLATEVLERQPADVQEFLLRTSILEHVGTAECRLLTGREDAHDVLACLADENLFVVPLSGHGGAYRYHHLFAEFLRAESARRDPEGARRLNRTAAEWFFDQGDEDQAVRHWLAAGDVQRAADTVASIWPVMWSRGQLETVRRWLEGFSDEQILAHPGLTLAAGWVLTALSDARLGQRWGQAACSARLGDEPSPDGAVSLRSSQALLRATLGLDGVKRMREDAELAAKLECAPGASWYADAQGILGVALWLSGSERRAETALERAAREGAASNASAELAALGTLSLIAADRGDWEAARDFADRAAACLEESGFGTRRRSLPMLLARARLLARDADPGLNEVEERVVRVLERMVPHPWMTLLAGVMLGEAQLEAGNIRAAQGWSRRAVESLRHYPDPGILGPRTEHLRKAVEEAAGAEPLTPAERRILELLPTHMSETQIGEQLFVSVNTVKTHLRGVYRKLGVASRAEAVARARELGLLKKP